VNPYVAGSPPPLLERIIAWATSEANILALIMTGSRARAGQLPPPDEFSDFDLEVIADDVNLLVGEDRWWRQFAPVWVYWFDEDPLEPTRLIVYDNAQKVDFSLYGRERILHQREKLDPLYERGYRVLLDKQQLTADLPPPTGAFPVAPAPTQAEFTSVVNEFWFEAFHIPGLLVREDLWVVKFRDWTMKEMLLKMLEWRATATGPTDVWYIGRRLGAWVDAATWQEIGLIYGRFDRFDSWRALLATIELFSRVARETAARLGLHYPETPEASVREYLRSFETDLAG
jgi:aminoglycoside 6-adenylyltransferase